MKELSADLIALLNQEVVGTVILFAVEFTHVASGEVIRIVDNTEDVTIGGNTYSGVGFALKPPQEQEDDIRTASITINNTTQFMTEFIRGLSGKITARILVVTPTNLGASPPEFNNIEYEWLPIQVGNISYNTSEVQITLILDPLSVKQFPVLEYTPFTFPGVF